MSNKNRRPADNRQTSGNYAEEPEQDESGKTDAPKSETGGAERNKRGQDDRKRDEEQEQERK